MDRILVGVNGSPASTAAVVWVAGEASMRNVELTIVHVLAASSEADTQTRPPAEPLLTPDDPVQALLNHSRHTQSVVIGGSRRGSFVAEPFGGVSSAVAQPCRIPVIVARQRPPGLQPEMIGDRRKTKGLGGIQ